MAREQGLKIVAGAETPLPCPWCGATELSLVAVPYKRVYCKTCDALGPSPVDGKGINRNNGIALWNRRDGFIPKKHLQHFK